MAVAERNQRPQTNKAMQPAQRGYLPWVILTIGISLSIVAFVQTKDWEQSVTHTDFEILSASHSAAVYNELSRHLDASAALLGLFDVSSQIDRRQFTQFTTMLMANHSDVQALMWAPRVAANQRADLAQRAAEDGFMNFHIHDVGGNAMADTTSAPTDLSPIYYVYPEKSNDELLGFDLMSDPAYRGLLETARDSGQLTVSPPVQLNLKSGDRMGNGILLVQAAYLPDADLETVAGRRAGLRGYVLQLFRIGDLIEEALRESAVLGLDISVVYGKDADDASRNYFHSSASRPNHIVDPTSQTPANGLQLHIPLDALGKSWGLMFTPAPRFWSNHQMWTAWMVLAAGLLLTICLTTTAILLGRRTAQAR